MPLNLQKFIKNQSKLVEKKTTKRVSKISLNGKTVRGVAKFHIVPDTNELPMLTTKNVFEVHQTETYEYQDETRTRYPTYTIPDPINYKTVEGAVLPTEMQLAKLGKLCNKLAEYQALSNPYQEGGPKIKSADTDTQMWVKNIGTYTKFWAKINEIKPATPDPKAKEVDTSKLLMVTHGSANFVKAFNKWATIDEDAEISVDEQLAKLNEAVSTDITDSARCIKVNTTKAAIGYDVEITNINPDKASVEITQEDIESATPLIQEDWDFTVFDDEKVDTLLERVTEYLKGYSAEDEDDDDSDDEDEDEDEDEAKPSKKSSKSDDDDEDDNPFSDDDDE